MKSHELHREKFFKEAKRAVGKGDSLAFGPIGRKSENRSAIQSQIRSQATSSEFLPDILSLAVSTLGLPKMLKLRGPAESHQGC
jgi:hypothetical protein